MTNNEKDKLLLNFEDKVEIYGDIDVIKRIEMKKNNIEEEK
jgi:hypothetical protein